MKGDRERCLEAGMDGYLAKPVALRDLHQALADLTGRAPSRPGPPPCEGKNRAMTEPVNPSPVFDPQVALTRVGGDEELLRELTAVFLADSPAWLNDARAAAARGDAVGLRRAAHTIKGAVGYFGAAEATAAAARVEELGRADDPAGAAAALPDLEQALDRLTAALRAAGPGSSTPETPT